jgi:hypothetical protein
LEGLGDPLLALEFPALRDVLDRADHPGHRSVRRSLGARPREQRPRVAVRSDDAVFDVGDLLRPFLEDACDVRPDARPVVRESELDRSIERDRLAGRDPVDPIHLTRPVDGPRDDVPVPRSEVRELLRLAQPIVGSRELPRPQPHPLLELGGRLLELETGARAFAHDRGEEERREGDRRVECLEGEHPARERRSGEEPSLLDRRPRGEQRDEQRCRRRSGLLEAPGGPAQDREQQEEDREIRDEDERGDADQGGTEPDRLEHLPAAWERMLADRGEGEEERRHDQDPHRIAGPPDGPRAEELIRIDGARREQGRGADRGADERARERREEDDRERVPQAVELPTEAHLAEKGGGRKRSERVPGHDGGGRHHGRADREVHREGGDRHPRPESPAEEEEPHERDPRGGPERGDALPDERQPEAELGRDVVGDAEPDRPEQIGPPSTKSPAFDHRR